MNNFKIEANRLIPVFQQTIVNPLKSISLKLISFTRPIFDFFKTLIFCCIGSTKKLNFYLTKRKDGQNQNPNIVFDQLKDKEKNERPVNQDQINRDQIINQDPTQDQKPPIVLDQLNNQADQKVKDVPIQVQQLQPVIPPINYSEFFEEIKRETEQVPFFPTEPKNCIFVKVVCPSLTNVKIEGTSKDFYLHANDIKIEGEHFIASQYPKDSHFSLFWKAAIEQASLIVDLTNAHDSNRRLNFTHPYYPTSGIELHSGMQIALMREPQKVMDKGWLYHYSVSESQNANGNNIVSRLNFGGFDGNNGISINQLDELIKQIKLNKGASTKPVLIHCQTGIGPTGAVIVVCVLDTLIAQKKVNKDNYLKWIKTIILECRKQRGPRFVRSPDQLKSICEWCWSKLQS